jgi:hypothetical protein
MPPIAYDTHAMAARPFVKPPEGEIPSEPLKDEYNQLKFIKSFELCKSFI